MKVDRSLELDQKFGLKWIDLEELLSSRETFLSYSDGILVYLLVCLIVYTFSLAHNQVPKKEVLVQCRTNWTCLYRLGPMQSE